MIKIVLTFFLLISFSCSFAQSSKAEQKIVTAVDTHHPQALELLREVVNINSGTMNFEGVQKIGRLFINELDALGFETRWSSGESFNRAGHLIAQRIGKNSKVRILLIGHLDTVFELHSPFQKYTMLNDSIMKGPGAADMKGGNVIILLAIKALKEAGLLEEMTLEIVMTGDEEDSGSPIELSKKDIIDAAERADIALAFENGDNDPTTVLANRRGSAAWQLHVKGNPAHSSQIFTEQVGVGAIYETSRILNEFYTRLSIQENLTFNPGLILAGTSIVVDTVQSSGTAYGKSNVVAEEAYVNGDLRAVSLEQLQLAKMTMQEIVKDNYPGTTARLSFDEGAYPPFSITEGNMQLLQKYSKVSEDLGFGKVRAVNPRNAGAADISFTSGLVQMGIDGLGLTGSGDHTEEETANLNVLAMQAKRAAVLMYRLTR